MYSIAPGLGQIRYSGPTIPYESDARCAEGFFVQRWTNDFPPPMPFAWPEAPQGFVLYRPVGALYAETIISGGSAIGPFLAYVLVREIRTTVQEGDTLQEVYTPDAPGAAFLADPIYYQKYFQICGPTFPSLDGRPQIVVDTWQHVTLPSERPPDPIEVSGVLTTYTAPGVAVTWPMVGGYVLSSSRRWPTEAADDFAARWNRGELRPGTELRVRGYPTTDTPPKLIPVAYEVLSYATEPTAPTPWEIDFPEPIPTGAEPVPITPSASPYPPSWEIVPTDTGWNGQDQIIPTDADGMAPDGGVVTPPPETVPTEPWIPTEPDTGAPPPVVDAGPAPAPAPSTPAGAPGITMAKVAFAGLALLFLPTIVRKGKDKPAAWDMGDRQ